MERSLPLCGLVCALLAGCSSESVTSDGADKCTFREAADDYQVPPITTPRWAFEPWISKDISSTDDTYAFVGGFKTRDIPVGVVVLDSPWETHYNTFVPHPERYHDFDKLVGDLRNDGIRVVLWITQMVNTIGLDFETGGDSYAGPSPNYEQGLDCGFYIDDGQTYGWWKGVGSGVDFSHPQGVAWWHRQIDHVLDKGVNGFKLDFGDSYVRNPMVKTYAGTVPHQQYSEAYYRDFYAYGTTKRGADEYVTMSRPYDESYDFEGRFHARPEHMPIGWVGDNRRDWVGLEDALDHMFRSAKAGYVAIGSDIGGYLDANDKNLSEKIPFDTENFDRWTAVGALTPFMQLHGRTNISPWTVPDTPDQTVTVYRYWSWLHHELVPFFYSLAQHAYAGGQTIMRPIGEPAAWPGDYRYMLGDALLVAPILAAGGKRDVELPAGARWYDWWNPADAPIVGPKVLEDYDVSQRVRIPLFVREGAIVPLNVSNDVTGHGTKDSKGLLTLLVYPSSNETTLEVYDEDDAITKIAIRQVGADATVKLSRSRAGTILRVRSETPAASVTSGTTALVASSDQTSFGAAAEGFYNDAANKQVWVKVAGGAERVITVTSL